MQRKIFFLFLSFLFVLVSCDKKQELTFETTKILGKDFECDSDCPDISIEEIRVKSTSRSLASAVEKINAHLSEHYIYSLTLNEEDVKEIESIEEAVNRFIVRYQEDKASFPDMAAKYEASIHSKVLHQSEEMLSMRVFTHLYTGGAHGYSSVSYLNFDPNTGEAIAVEQILVNIDEFIDFVEMKFREAYKIPQDSDINSTKFWFEGDRFILASNIGFDEENMLFTYNPYDIAPYSEGLIELKIPIREVQIFLNKKLK